VLFKQRFLSGIRAGEITLAFRRWRRPTVRAGGTLTTAVGVLSIESVEAIAESTITVADARWAGYSSRDELIAELRGRTDGILHRVKFHRAGPDPRIALRDDSVLSNADVAEVQKRLERLDRAGRKGPWTEKFLRLIHKHPAVRAADLAAMVDRDTAGFKINVRKLKNLGLTESLDVGYRISPRGHAILKVLGKKDSG
jgi:hypothetical protein